MKHYSLVYLICFDTHIQKSICGTGFSRNENKLQSARNIQLNVLFSAPFISGLLIKQVFKNGLFILKHVERNILLYLIEVFSKINFSVNIFIKNENFLNHRNISNSSLCSKLSKVLSCL